MYFSVHGINLILEMYDGNQNWTRLLGSYPPLRSRHLVRKGVLLVLANRGVCYGLAAELGAAALGSRGDSGSFCMLGEKVRGLTALTLCGLQSLASHLTKRGRGVYLGPAQVWIEASKMARTSISLLLLLTALSALAEDSLRAFTAAESRKYWLPKSNSAQSRPNTHKEFSGDRGCVVMGMVIEPDGTTSNHQGIFAFPDDSFVDYVIRHWKRTEFEPTPENENREPIYVVYSMLLAQTRDEELRRKLSAVCDKGEKAYWDRLLAEG